MKCTYNYKTEDKRGLQDFCTNSLNYFCIMCLHIAVICVHAIHSNQALSLSLTFDSHIKYILMILSDSALIKHNKHKTLNSFEME